jgi:hypothetical protein
MGGTVLHSAGQLDAVTSTFLSPFIVVARVAQSNMYIAGKKNKSPKAIAISSPPSFLVKKNDLPNIPAANTSGPILKQISSTKNCWDCINERRFP